MVGAQAPSPILLSPAKVGRDGILMSSTSQGVARIRVKIVEILANLLILSSPV